MNAGFNRAFNGGMQDKNISAEKDFPILTDGKRDSFRIDGGMRGKKRKITRYRQRLHGELRLY